MLAAIEKLAGEVDALVPTVAVLAGVPENTFQTAPSSVDLANFGNRVLNLESYRAVSANETVTSTPDRILGDTSGGAFTLTLPLAPSIGDWVEVWDATSDFATNNLTIARNSENIEGVASDYIENRSNARIKLVYASASRGWLIGDLT